MTPEETNDLGKQLARIDQSLTDICKNQDRQENALTELFQGIRDVGSKMSSLDVVVRMSTSEQKRINERMQKEICDLEQGHKVLNGSLETEQKSCKESLDQRMRGMERQLAYFAGGLAVLLFVFDLLLRYGFKN